MVNQEKELFLRALDLPENQRSEFVHNYVADEKMATRILALLEAHRVGDNDVMDKMRKSVKEANEDRLLTHGSTLNHPHYRFGKRIGYGGFSEVFEGERLHPFPQPVALKVLLNTPKHQTLFLREAKILGSLRHENIAQIYDMAQLPDGRFFLVMELVEGKPITEYSEEHQLTIQERLLLFRSLCAAVTFAHQNLIIHRDLKPNNILVTKEGVVKLLDFGVSKILSESLDTHPTQTENFAFTPAFAAPEQLRFGAVSMATDVYALGVLGYAILTGAMPFQIPKGASPVMMEKIVSTQTVRPLSHFFRPENNVETAILLNRKQSQGGLFKTLSGDLDAIFLKATSKEPNERYRSAGAFLEEIGRYLAGQPVLAQYPSRTYLFKKFVSRNKFWVGLSAFVLLLIFTTLGIVLWQNAQVTREQARAEAEAEKNKTVIQFLTGLLMNGSTDVTTQAVDTLRFRTVVARGAADIIKNKTFNPQAYAEMSHVFGMLYDNWGRKDKALQLFKEAYAACKENQFVDIPCEFDLPSRIAIIHARQGDLAQAIAIFDDLAMKRPEALNSDITYTGFLHNIGALKLATGQFQEAQTVFEKIMAILGAKHRSDINELRTQASTLAYLGRVYEQLGRFDQAVQAYQKSNVISLSKESLKNTAYRPKMFEIMRYANQGRTNTSLAQMDSLIRSQERQAINSKETLIPLFHRFGLIQADAGRRVEALYYWQKALQIEKTLHGDRSAEALGLRLRIINAGLNKNSDTLLEKELTAITMAGHSFADVYGLALQVKGRFFLERGAPNMAVKLLEEARAFENKIWKIPNRNKALTLFYLAQAYLKNGQRTMAAATAQTSLEMYKKTLGIAHREYVEVQTFKAKLGKY